MKNLLIGSGIFILLLLGAYLAYTYGINNPSTTVINAIRAEYEEMIKEKEDIIKAKEEALVLSEKRYMDLKKKIKVLEATVPVAPKTDKEMRDRYEKAGYPPLPVTAK